MNHWWRARLEVVHSFGDVPRDGQAKRPRKLGCRNALSRERVQQMAKITAWQVLEDHAWKRLQHHSLQLDQVGVIQTANKEEQFETMSINDK